MSTYAVTFGIGYAEKPHPTLGMRPELAGGWLTLEARSLARAQHLAHILTEGEWADVRPIDSQNLLRSEFYPHGNLGGLLAAIAEAERRAEATDEPA